MRLVLFHFPCNLEQNGQELRQIPWNHFFLEWLCGRAGVCSQSAWAQIYSFYVFVAQLIIGHSKKMINVRKYQNIGADWSFHQTKTTLRTLNFAVSKLGDGVTGQRRVLFYGLMYITKQNKCVCAVGNNLCDIDMILEFYNIVLNCQTVKLFGAAYHPLLSEEGRGAALGYTAQLRALAGLRKPCDRGKRQFKNKQNV